MKIKVNSELKDIDIKVAKTVISQTVGLIGQKNIDFGLFFPAVDSVHMFFMSESIDIIIFDKDGFIYKLYENVKPNRFIRIFWKNRAMLELPAGYIKNNSINESSKIVFLT